MPGERTFYLQVRQGSDLISVSLEKQQAIALAERIDEIVEEACRLRGIDLPGEPSNRDSNALDAPIVEEFRVASLALGWDDTANALVIEAHADGDEMADIGSDDEDAPDTLRIWLSIEGAREFTTRTRRVVAAGRPPCPFCSQPLDPTGHICPRANGFKRR
jgi:uncharacterized repeat protein (TIGR03847 family)